MPDVQVKKWTKTQKSSRKISNAKIGLVLPFQPSMQDEKSIQHLLKVAMANVQKKLEGNFELPYINSVLSRLAKVFNNLNVNSHRKSVAVILGPEDDKVIYLDFRTRPVTFIKKSVSMLELAANTILEPAFFILQLQENTVELFEYFNNRLNKVYYQKHPVEGLLNKQPDNIAKNVFNIIKLMNTNYEKPVFMTGNNRLVEQYYREVPFPEIVFKKGLSNLDEPVAKNHLLIAAITHEWRFWQSKLLKGKLLMAQKGDSLISNPEVVLRALKHKKDGLLLIDKKFKQQLFTSRRTSSLFNIAEELMNEIEQFLSFGNRVEITSHGLLKTLGGIALIQHGCADAEQQLLTRQYERNNNNLLF